MLVLLLFVILKRGGGGTVQQLILHGSLFSNFAFGSIGGVLERVAYFAQM